VKTTTSDISELANLGELGVVIIDDHEAIRIALASVCEQNQLKLLASTDTVDQALAQLGDAKPDVAVLDLSLSDGSRAEENVQKLVSRSIPVLIFSIADKSQLVRSALKAGAAALVPKSHSMTELIDAIRMVAAGVLVNNLQTTAVIDADSEFKRAKLSPREQEVLSLYASGLALKQVAYELNIKVHTAKEHIDRVRSKYANVGRPAVNKTELLMRAIEDGLIDEGTL
jgi:DNA-binding NarL/FixJ family response regulator